MVKEHYLDGKMVSKDKGTLHIPDNLLLSRLIPSVLFPAKKMSRRPSVSWAACLLRPRQNRFDSILINLVMFSTAL